MSIEKHLDGWFRNFRISSTRFKKDQPITPQESQFAPVEGVQREKTVAQMEWRLASGQITQEEFQNVVHGMIQLLGGKEIKDRSIHRISSDLPSEIFPYVYTFKTTESSNATEYKIVKMRIEDNEHEFSRSKSFVSSESIWVYSNDTQPYGSYNILVRSPEPVVLPFSGEQIQSKNNNIIKEKVNIHWVDVKSLTSEAFQTWKRQNIGI